MHAQWLPMVEGAQAAVKNLIQQVQDSLVKGLINLLITQGIKALVLEVVGALSSGGVGTAIRWVSQLIQYLGNKAGQICGLVQTIINGVRLVLSGEGPNAIANVIISALKQAIPLLLDAITVKLGVGTAKGAIKRVMDGIMMIAQRPIDAILDFVYNLFQKYVAGWIVGSGLQGEQPPLIIPEKQLFDDKMVVLWISAKDKEPKLK
jgi:hypothetical protein